MKLSSLGGNRRSNSFRSTSSPLDSSVAAAADATSASLKSQSTSIFWLVIHGVCCLISLVLGFRFSRLIFLLIFSSSPASYTPTLIQTDVAGGDFSGNGDVLLRTTAAIGNKNISLSSSRVVVGRHGIRIRPWPHPDPVEVMKAHMIIERVQKEQRMLHGVKTSKKTVIAITPTYVRTFQALHLTGVMHSLMNLVVNKDEVIWIVVEAGEATNETYSLISKSGLRIFHVGLDDKMPNTWQERHLLEAKMRLRGLRVVREEKLDGIVMFADDSNMHSMELFDEIQNVKWMGAVSVGILAHSNSESVTIQRIEDDGENSPMPVQGPACNSSQNLVGWHTFNSLPYKGKNAVYIDDRAVVLPRKLEWAGFVMNSRLVWKVAEDKPEWVKDFDLVDGDIESPLSLLKDSSKVEPLGDCGRKVMLWWLRVEARSDSKFPSGWNIDPPLEITVPAKRTPWPDAPPELPVTEKVAVLSSQENTEKPRGKTRTPRSRRSRNKRKHDVRQVDTQDSTRHSREN